MTFGTPLIKFNQQVKKMQLNIIKQTGYFKPYHPPEGLKDVAYICDEKNNCWYDLQKKYYNDHLKLLVDDDNIIVGFTKDASAIFPEYLKVVEVDLTEAPADDFINKRIDATGELTEITAKITLEQINNNPDLTAEQKKALIEDYQLSGQDVTIEK